MNSEYVRHGDLDLEELFTLHDTKNELQDIETVQKQVANLREILDSPELETVISKTKCNKFYECGYKYHCWKDIPEYSVFNVFRGKLADEIYSKYGADLRNIPPEIYAKRINSGDIESFLNNTDIINKDVLRKFTDSLCWPLYYLDYESIMPAVPMFDNSRPYQQICFQFSLHVQSTPDAQLEHYEYLHKIDTDPRPDLIKN